MANLSQQRRQRMLDFLQKVREKNKDDDDALVAIGEIENEITEKKYGLVWEEHSEEVEERMVEEVPVFTEVHDKEIALTDDGYNFLLEGDNLHSLHLLEKTHKEKIDVIYIDPPYNTGNDFVYDDNFVKEEDSFRHSKWLSFMERRLRIAKTLLSENGVIFISINDIEHSQLKMLCDEVFGAENFVDDLVWANQEGGGSSDSKFFKHKHEYIICYSKNISYMREIKNVDIEDLDRYRLSDEYESTRGRFQLVKLSSASLQYSDSLNYELSAPDGTIVTPADNTNKDRAIWRWSKKRYDWGVDNGFIVWKKDKSGVWQVYTKQYVNCDKDGNIVIRTKKPMALVSNFSSTQGSNVLFQIMGSKTFSYPKPADLIKWLIERFSQKQDTILDFFAGSGTTGQAVLELNKEDGGNRKFILCTNNENNICEGVTYPRLQTVITGMRQDGNKYSDGIPANLKYYKTDYIPKKSDNLSADLIKHIDEMIQLEYHVKIDKDKYISVLTDEDADELEKNWQNFPDIRAIYISRSVLLTGKQRELFETKDCFVIPDYYFREELRDAGEA